MEDSKDNTGVLFRTGQDHDQRGSWSAQEQGLTCSTGLLAGAPVRPLDL